MSDERPALHLVPDGASDAAPSRLVRRGRYFAHPSHPKGVPIFSAKRTDGSDVLQCYVFSDDPREIDSAHARLEALARELLEREGDA